MTSSQSRPNIVVICTDQQRYDSLGCNGNEVAHTPNLDALAASGARLDNHIVANPVCMPSRASFLTGRFPNAHHVWTNGVSLPASERTLPQELQRLGYDTRSVGKLHLTPTQAFPAPGLMESIQAWRGGALDGWSGPYYGFDHVDLTIGHGDMTLQAGHYADDVRRRFPEVAERFARRRPEPEPRPSIIPLEAHHSTWVADKAVEYLRHPGRTDRPFFLYCSFPDPHHPFTAPEPYASMFDETSMPAPQRREDEHLGKPRHYSREGFADLMRHEPGSAVRLTRDDDARLRRITAHTYGMVSLIDASVGRILDTLRDAGLDDNTIVVFTSDHGELLGDHWLLRKGQFPCGSLLRVCGLIRVPGTTRPGTVVTQPTSNTDMFPTLLTLAGGQPGEWVQGRSLIEGLQDGAQRDSSTTALTMGWCKSSTRYHHVTLFTDRWRITHWPNLEDGELYDLDADPGELTNLFREPGHKGVRDDLLLELYSQYQRTAEPTPAPICDY